MSPSFIRVLAFSCVMFLSAFVAAKEQPKEGSAPRVDLYGDPLPDGAIGRLGSIRLRHAGLGDFVFLSGGKEIVSAGSDRIMRFWDWKAGKQVREVKLQGTANPSRPNALSPDGKTLAAKDMGSIVI